MTACALSVLALASCAASPKVATTNWKPMTTTLFISPQGEPFRAAKGVPTPVDQWFAQADRDGDHRISRAEFLADSQAFFAKLDANMDGFVVSSEVTSMQQRLAPEVLRTYGPLEDFVGPGEASAREQMARDPEVPADKRAVVLERAHGAQAYTWLNEIEPVMSADADLNGKVSLDEFQAAAARRFDKLDVNHDGYFVLAEAPQPHWRRVGNLR